MQWKRKFVFAVGLALVVMGAGCGGSGEEAPASTDTKLQPATGQDTVVAIPPGGAGGNTVGGAVPATAPDQPVTGALGVAKNQKK